MTDREELERRVIAAHILNATPEDDDLAPAKGVVRGVLVSLVGFALIYLVAYAILVVAS